MTASRGDPPASLGTRRLFLRLLGLVYLLAFASLASQVLGLVGQDGLLPIAGYLDWVHAVHGAAAYRLLPTLLWFDAGDPTLRLMTWSGILLALLLLIGIAPLLSLVLLWVLYLSLAVAGQDFLSFQWDSLLLETGILAILWAPATWRLGRRERRPSDLARFLLVFLLFKLMFLSGATKLLSGDATWRHLTALDYHFETQPLPPWTAWYAHQLPREIHRGLVVLTYGVELVVPWLLLLPPRFRSLRFGAAAAIALFQAGIALTGNYGFFNLLTVVLCVPVLDDAALSRFRLARVHREVRAEGLPRRTFVRLAGPLLLVLSGLSLVREVAYTLPAGRGAALWPRWGEQALAWVGPLRSINGYGLFRVMTTRRPELILEGSRDSVHWEAYECRYKPGAVDRRPRFVAPLHPRLDWQLWFAALDPIGNSQLLESLAARLRAGTPEVLALFARNPFGTVPPHFVRAALYDYRFTTADERRRTGAWWVRELRGTFVLDAEPAAAR